MGDQSQPKIVFQPFTEEHIAAMIPWVVQLYQEELGVEEGDELTDEQRGMVAAYVKHYVMANPSNELYALEVDGEFKAVVGLMAQNPLEGSAELFTVVDPEYRGKGLGRGVTRWLVSKVVPARFQKLKALCSSAEVVNMLRKVGFKEAPVSGVLMELSVNGSQVGS